VSQTVSDYFIARLREWNVEQVFGYPGDGINGLLAGWGRSSDVPPVRAGTARGNGRI
jgi:pyruvate dehydrogenase (quinone)